MAAKDDAMPKTERLLAEPVSRILSINTGVLVGWVYRWNNGDVQEAWLNGPQVLVYHQPLARALSHELRDSISSADPAQVAEQQRRAGQRP